MSAKLACSAHNISGFSATRIRRDLCKYSPLFRLVTIRHDGQLTTASLGKLFTVRARYRPMLGSAIFSPLNAGYEQHLSTYVPANTNRRDVKSPGAGIRYQNSQLQQLLCQQVRLDNLMGLDTRAVLVMRDWRILGEAYGSGITATTPLFGWSLTKSVIALLLGRMETLGLMDRHAGELFPAWSGDDRSVITLHNLLQMCDGLHFCEDYRLGSDVTRMLFGRAPCSRYALERPLQHTPGTQFSYASGSTNLLTRWMHERLGGTEKVLHFLQKVFIEPLDTPSVLIELDDDGVLVGSSYGYGTARDWARIGQLYASSGALAGTPHETPFIDPHWISQAAQPNTSDNDIRYGYQLWLNCPGRSQTPCLHPRLPEDSLFMLGNREQKVMVSASRNIVIVRLGWSATPYPVEERFAEILEAVAD